MELIDATAMANEFPETFQLPEIDLLKDIDKDWVVKVCDGTERFWTIVESIEWDNNDVYNTTIKATINNHLYPEKTYNYGDTIKYTLRNIYAVKCPVAERVRAVQNYLQEQGFSEEDSFRFILANTSSI